MIQTHQDTASATTNDLRVPLPGTPASPAPEASCAGTPASASPEPLEEGEAFLNLVEGFLLGKRTLGEAMGISAEDVEAMAALGDQFLEMGHVDRALEVYEGCAVIQPAGPTLLARLATCADLQGRTDDRDVYLEALEQTWDGEDRQRLEAFLRGFERAS